MLTFRPNCTLPSATTAYVYPANSRGTLEILWSCLSILILCLWNVVHINVRAPLSPSVAWSKPWFYSKARTFLLKIQWMTLTFLAPEILLAKALHDKIIISESVKTMQKFATADRVRWTATHAHFANMGAFVVRFPPFELSEVESLPLAEVQEDTDPQLHNADSDDDSTHKVTIDEDTEHFVGNIAEPGESIPGIHIEQVVRGAEVEAAAKAQVEEPTVLVVAKDDVELAVPSYLQDSFERKLKTIPPRYGREIWQTNSTNSARVYEALESLKKVGVASIRLRARQRNALALQGTIWILDAAQIQVARSFEGGNKPLLKLPDVHEEQLEAQSKSDPLLKLLTVLQITWMVIQLIVRLYRHLPTSQLEVMTFSFAVCSVMTYIALLEKPKDVALTRTIEALRYPTASELLDIALAGPSTIFGYRSGYWIPNNAIHHLGNSSTMAAYGLTIQERIRRLDKVASYSRVIFIATGCAGAILFGSLHLISWNFHFPTPTERLLWRIATCVSVGLPLFGAIAQGLFAQLFQQTQGHRKNTTGTESYQRLYLRITAGLVSVVGALYLLVRVFVLVEVFRSLAYLPPEAYRTTWSVAVPHIS